MVADRSLAGFVRSHQVVGRILVAARNQVVDRILVEARCLEEACNFAAERIQVEVRILVAVRSLEEALASWVEVAEEEATLLLLALSLVLRSLCLVVAVAEVAFGQTRAN